MGLYFLDTQYEKINSIVKKVESIFLGARFEFDPSGLQYPRTVPWIKPGRDVDIVDGRVVQPIRATSTQ